MVQVWLKLVTKTLLHFLEDIFISNFNFLVLKTSNIIIYTFAMIQVWLKLVTMNLLRFLEDIPITNFDFFQKCSFFSNCCIFIAQFTYLKNIQYCKIYFHYGLSLTKTSYNDSASFFWKIFSFLISIFFKNVHFSQVFKLPHNYSPNYLF